MSDESFGVWFVRQLKRRRMTQIEFSREAGIARQTVNNWAKGTRTPDPESCDRIAEVLLLDRDEVLAKAGHRPAEHEDSELVREFSELLRRIEWTPDRENTVRLVLLGMASFDRSTKDGTG